MTDKEKRELKDGVVSIFKRFNILDHTSTIGNLRDGIIKYIDSLQEEPVSEELEKAAEKAAVETFFVSPKWTEIRKEQFKAGANWQKEQDQSIIELAEDHAMLAGMEKMKEQMMKDAMEVPLYSDGDFLTVDYDFSHEGFKVGDKVKLIIIKED